MSDRGRCGYTETFGLWAPLVCDRDLGHTGPHIDFRPNVSIGFGGFTKTVRRAKVREAVSPKIGKES
jgi:hypothetical protein